MYSHIASNDITEPLDFTGGWMTNTVVALVSGGYANYGTDKGKKWIDLDTNAGLMRLVGVDYQVKSGKAPAEDSSYFYWPVWPDKYLKVAKSASVDRVFSHTHQTSFDNVYGNGTKAKVVEIVGKSPVQLLSDTTGIRVDGSKFSDTIVLNDKGSVAYSNNGSDTVFGGDGPDLMFGGNGRDYLYGGDGKDTLNGDNGNDRLFGGEDNDTLHGGAHKDTLYGGGGEDRLYGDWQNDVLFGDADNDLLYGGDNNDRLYGGAGEDTLRGGNDKDLLDGGADNDVLYGGAHNDRLYGGIAQDALYGDAGNDKLYGDSDNDWIYGGKGNDRVDGGTANDFLYGGAGRDRLYGGSDNDRLDGGGASDVLSGGPGADTFVFSTRLGGGNVDRITDFENGTDGIWLSAKVFKKLPVGALDADYFHRGSKAADKNDHIIYDPKRGVVIYDKNGSNKGGEQVFAKVNKKADLHNSDFYVKYEGDLIV